MATLCAAVGIFALTAAPALALKKYKDVSSFEPVPNIEPWGLGVEQATGEVFVADVGSVQRFSPVNRLNPSEGYSLGAPLAGSFTEAWGVGVDDSGGLSQGDVYVADSAAGVVDKFDALGLPDEVNPPSNTTNQFGAGAKPIALERPGGVAVDPADGYIYVADNRNSVVDVYTPTGEFVPGSQFATGPGPLSLAFNSAGDLYVLAYGFGNVEEYDSSGGPVDQTAGPHTGTNVVDESGRARAVAVDTSTNDVYVDEEGSHVAVFESSGERLTNLEFQNEIPFSLGIAVDSSTHTVFVSDHVNGVVEVFAEIEAPETPETQPATLEGLSATLHGELKGGETAYYFAYNTNGGCTGGSTTSEVSAAGETAVSAQIGPLTPGVQYTFCLVAKNAEGETEGTTQPVEVPVPPVVEAVGASTITPQAPVEVTLEATVNPERHPTTCVFEYGETTSYGSTLPCEPEESLGEGFGPVPVTRHVKELKPGTTYHYRVFAASAAGHTGETDPTEGEGEFTTLPGEPIVGEESFSHVGATIATVSAQVDPVGFQTTYHFEYGTASVTEHSTPTETLGAAHAPVAVTAHLSDLREDATYHFRAVAESTPASTTYTVPGAEGTFTTYPASAYTLPDGRVFEMVTTPENNDAEIYAPEASGPFTAEEHGGAITTSLPFQASPDGDAVTYVGQTTTGGTGNVGGGGKGNEFLATRNAAGGWTPRDISPAGHPEARYEAFSSDLSVGLLVSLEEPVLSPEAPGAYIVLYSYTFDDESYHALFATKPPNRSPEEFGTVDAEGRLEGSDNKRLLYAGASTNMEHLLFEANDALTPNAEGDRPSSEQNDLYDSVAGQLHVVNVLPGETEATPNATFGSIGEPPDFSNVISEDGSRVFWTDLNTGDLYVRENDTTTVPVSAGSARFWTATPDGGYVFYTEGEQLLRFDFARFENGIKGGVPEPEALSQAREPLTGPGAEVRGVIGAGDGGEYVYFVTEDDDLYVSHGGLATFIATLSGEDVSREIAGQTYGDVQPGLGRRTAEVTPSGQSVVFMSNRSLTGYTADGTYGPMSEVFVYNADDNRLICASCSPSGEPPSVTEPIRAAYLPNTNSNQNSDSATYLPRWINDEGTRVFFDSFEPLVPLATDGRQDVYEWEREGVGSCPVGSAKGCVYLLSGGTSPNGSYLIDASASGDDVFIASRTQLTQEENPNENLNLFDARVGGVQPITPTACSGTGCQGVPPAPPIFATPASATFNGVGNFPPPPPTKPKARTAAEIRAEALKKALKTCRTKKNKHKRVLCEAKAKRKYGPAKKAKKSSRDRRAK